MSFRSFKLSELVNMFVEVLFMKVPCAVVE